MCKELNFDSRILILGINIVDNNIFFANSDIAEYLNTSVANLMNKNYLELLNDLSINNYLPKHVFSARANTADTLSFDYLNEQIADISWKNLIIQNKKLHLLIGIDTAYTRMISDKNIELQTYLDNILGQIPGYLYWKDKNSTYLGCNANFAKVAGLNSPHEIIGKTDYELAWGETEADLFQAGDQDALLGIAKLNFEEPQLQANGKHATVLASKVPLYNKEKNIIGVLGIYNDITARKKVEHDLAIAKVKAEAANRAKSEFIENMSHDLKTPLNGILGLSTILLAKEDDPKKRELIEGIKESGDKLLFLLNEILELGRLEEGYIPIQKKEFNLRALIEDIRSLMLIQAQEKNIQLLVNYPITITDCIISDRHRIHRIVLNLVNNALKFTHSGKVEIDISKASNNQSEIIISIKDTGIGIPEEKLNVIFERFTRLEASYKGGYQGSGIGLGIVKQFLTDLGGKIIVNSELGKGTIFNCLLPIALPINQAYSIKNDNTVAKEMDKDRRGTVLIVEDEKLSQIVISSLLQELNCPHTLAMSAEQALKNLDRKYDLILTDIGLPDKNGIMLAKLMRENYNIKVPIIAITAHLSEALEKKCLQNGIQAAYAKPITKETLQKIIDIYLPLAD